MLDLWLAALREGKARLRPLFKHPSVADSATLFLDGLLGPKRRKTGWMRAEAAIRSCWNSGRIRAFTSRSDEAHSSSATSTEVPVIHDLRIMVTQPVRPPPKTQL